LHACEALMWIIATRYMWHGVLDTW